MGGCVCDVKECVVCVARLPSFFPSPHTDMIALVFGAPLWLDLNDPLSAVHQGNNVCDIPLVAFPNVNYYAVAH